MNDSRIAIFLRRIAALFQRRQMEQDLADELAFHEQMKEDELRRSQIRDPSTTRRAIGSSLSWREKARDAWGWTFLDEFFCDVRYALRGLRKSPGFATAAILSLGLGIGADTILFSVMDPLFLRPFPFPDPQQIVFLVSTDGRNTFSGVPPASFDALVDRVEIAQVGAALSTTVDLGEAPYPERLPAQRVTASFFEVLGVPPVIGRAFDVNDEALDAAPVLMLGEEFWRTHFGSDPGIVGQTIPLRQGDNRTIYTIIGVVAPETQVGVDGRGDVWIPLRIDGEAESRGLQVRARLNSNTSIEAAEQAMQAAVTGTAEYQDVPRTVRLSQGNSPDEMFVLLMGGCGFVLLIACAGVANLQLARGLERAKDLAVRAAIGAGRLRLFRQLLTESLTLSLFGGILGAVLAVGVFQIARGMLPEPAQILGMMEADPRVFVFTLVLSLAACLLFGVVPAWRASRSDLRDALSSASGGGPGRSLLRNGLIVAEVALTLVLVVGGVLMLESYANFLNRQLGFARDNLILTSIALPVPMNDDSMRRISLEQEIEQRLAALPGIVSAGYADTRPFANSMSVNITKVASGDAEEYQADWAAVSADYFRAMQQPLLRGRVFNDRDLPGSQPVALVSEQAARELWPDRDPLGQLFSVRDFGTEPDSAPVVRQIVGVVGDAVNRSLTESPRPKIYVPHAQDITTTRLNLLLRTESGADAATLIPTIRTELAAINIRFAVDAITTMDGEIDSQLSGIRAISWIFSAFAAMGLMLTVVAVGGVVGYLVRARTYEFGVRMALGATSGDVLRMILEHGGRLALLGIAIGTIGAFAGSRLLRTMLYQVDPLDPAAMIVAPALLLLCVLLACYVPARRAMRIDPSQALRSE